MPSQAPAPLFLMGPKQWKTPQPKKGQVIYIAENRGSHQALCETCESETRENPNASLVTLAQRQKVTWEASSEPHTVWGQTALRDK